MKTKGFDKNIRGIAKLTVGVFFLLAFSCLLPIWGLTVHAGASYRPDQIVLSWTADAKTTQTLRWRTDSSVESSGIRYAIDSGSSEMPDQYQTAAANIKAISTDDGTVHSHSLTLTGLAPGTTYIYQVGGSDDWSPVHRFRTEAASAGSFKFLIMGDSQSLDYRVWRHTLQKATTDHADAAFLISMGDLVDVGQDYAEWEAWFAAGAGILERFPLMPLVGNHECYTPSRRFSKPVLFTAQFVLPANGPPDLQGQVYSFDYGNAHFVILDSQVGEQAHFVPDMLEQQRQWLDKDLAATTQPWKFVFMHRPLYGNKANGILAHLREAFEPIFEKHRVDAVFTAHDHVYARTWPMKGIVHIATGRTGTKTYPKLTAKEWNETFHNPVDQPNYLVVTLEKTRLRMGMIQQDGSLVDSWVLDKPDLSQ